MDFLEVSAKKVDDAITKACIELGLSSDQLDITVISEGSAGFLGIGSKPAVIQVRKKADIAEPESVKAEKTEAVEKPAKETVKKETAAKVEKTVAAEKKTEKPEKSGKTEKTAGQPKEKAQKKEERPKKEAAPKAERTEEEIASMKKAAADFMGDIFKAMDLPVEIQIDYEKEDDCLNINFEGEDMGILIGKRGQTLDSLQYLVSLVVNKDVKNYVRVKLDTEDYRRRRKETLENLAKNIANKVRRSRRPVSLEAMNPYERRIIHSALQNNKYVETHSEGNEPYRHVVVTPKKNV